MTRLSTALSGAIVAAAIAVLPVAAPAQNFVNVLTGGTSGTYYPLGVALSEVYAKNIDRVRTQVQSTKASVENLNLLQQGRGEIAFALGDSVAMAWQGVAEAGFPEPLDKLRGIAGIYANYVQIVADQDSGVATLADLAGRSLSVGAPASGTELNARKILEAAGITYDDLGKVEYLPFAESVELIKNRQLEATLQSSALGVASIRDLSTSMPITVVAVPGSVVETLGAPFRAGVIPAGTYEGQDADVETVTIPNFLITHADVSDEVAYQMTKLLFEHVEDLAASHQAARKISLETALDGMPVPLHPGAERFYREQGLIQ